MQLQPRKEIIRMSTEAKRLYRSRKERIIGGVCGGLGEYLGLDPTVVRLLFALFTIVYGFGLLAYIIMLLVVPLEPLKENEAIPPEKTSE
jgi:phage shock protein C